MTDTAIAVRENQKGQLVNPVTGEALAGYVKVGGKGNTTTVSVGSAVREPKLIKQGYEELNNAQTVGIALNGITVLKMMIKGLQQKKV